MYFKIEDKIEIKNFYKKFGYVIIKNFFKKNLIRNIRKNQKSRKDFGFFS